MRLMMTWWGMPIKADTMPKIAFRNGYLAAWHWIRGTESAPDPTPPVSISETPYRAGVAQGVLDAASTPAKSDRDAALDQWLDGALRRGLD
jgi:hypothetical protein